MLFALTVWDRKRGSVPIQTDSFMLHVCVQSAYLTLPLLLSLPPSPSLSFSPFHALCIGMPQHKQPFRYSGLEGVAGKESMYIKTQSQSQSASSYAFSFMSDVKYAQGGVGWGSTSQRYSVLDWVLELALTFVVSLLVGIHSFHSQRDSVVTLASCEVMRWVIISVVLTPSPSALPLCPALQRNVPRVGAAPPLVVCLHLFVFCCVCLAWKRFLDSAWFPLIKG